MNADLWGRRLCHNCTAALPSHHTFYPYAETRGFGTKTDDVTPICSRLLHLALSVHDIMALTRSVEENVSSEESGEIWFGSRLFFALFFFDSEDSATHRSLRYVFLYQASTHFVSVLSRPTDPPSPPFVSAHCHCDPLLACWLVKRTDGRTEWVSEEVYLCTDKQKKKQKTAIWLWVTACCSKFIEMYTTKFLFV